MADHETINTHYTHGNLLAAIEAALRQSGKSLTGLTVDDLGPVDEFHIGGRPATARLLRQLEVGAGDSVLDVGCGLGGSARCAALLLGCQVTGIDLTGEYVATGNVLCDWVGLGDQVNLQQGSALELPFPDASFAAAYMIHVGMNIPDKQALFAGLRRVIRPGGRLAVYDVMQMTDGAIEFPMPWATNGAMSYVGTPADYEAALAAAGFDVLAVNNRQPEALVAFDQQSAQNQANGGPPLLGLHVLVGETTVPKFRNMVAGVRAGVIAPVEIVAAVG